MNHSEEDNNDQVKMGEKEPGTEINSTVRVGKNLGKVIGVNIENLSLGVKIPGPVKWAILVLLIVALVGASGYGIWYWIEQRARAEEAESKVIVAVADFYGADPENYQVTENLIGKLRDGLAEYDDAAVVPLEEVIREQEGSERARELGEKVYADLVLWGSYQVADDVLVTLNIENLTGSTIIPLGGSYSNQKPVELAEFRSSDFRIRWSTEVGVYVEFILGLIRYEAYDYQAAKEILTEIVESDNFPDDLPGKTEARYYLGESYYYLGDFENGILYLNETLLFNPEHTRAYYSRGIIYSILREFDKAIADYNEALRIDPEYAPFYRARGFAYRQLGEYEKAIADYNEALRIDPEYATFYQERGDVYSQLGEYEKAIADYNEALRIDPDFAPLYLARGNAYHQLGEHEKAITNYGEALQLDPEFAAAYYERGISHSELGEFEKAIADFNEVLRLDPEVTFVYVNRGNAYQDLGEYDKAIADYTEALWLNPAIAPAYYHRGKALYFIQMYEKALEDLNRAIELGLEPEDKIYAEELREQILREEAP